MGLQRLAVRDLGDRRDRVHRLGRLRHTDDQGEYAENAGVEANSKLAVFGALSLYLSFINLFQMLLQLFGVQREE